MTHITSLDKGSVHRICSGQVVLTLGIGVKELLENALDAGAKRVEVGFTESGLETISVSDDGHGVQPHNYPGLALKHHTSKIRDFNDVAMVDTFGFRGEALSSLSALSHLTVTTRTAESKIGVELVYDHSGKLISTKNKSRDQGTTIVLKDLFYTLPVRRAELKKHIKREFSKMLSVLTSYALITQGLRLFCWNSIKGKRTTVLQTHGRSDVRETLKDVFGSKSMKDLQEIYAEEGIVKIKGYISSVKHGEGRNAPDRQFLYLNSRPADLNKIRRRINETYKSYNRHQYPFIFMNIITDKHKVDINVTPDKRQIFVENETFIIDLIQQTLNSLFQDTPSTFDVTPLSESIFEKFDEGSDNFRPKRSLSDPLSDKAVVKKQRTLDYSSGENILNVSLDDDAGELKKYSVKEVNNEDKLAEDAFNEKINHGHLAEKVKSFFKNQSESNNSNKLPEMLNNEDKDVPKESNNHSHLDDKVSHFLKKHCLNQSENESDDLLEMADNIVSDNYAQNILENKKSEPYVKSSTIEESKFSQSKTFESEALEQPPTIIIDDSSRDPTTKRYLNVDFNIDMIASMKSSSKKEEGLYRKFFAKICPEDNTSAEEELQKSISKESFKKMKILGQFNLGFIICLLDKDIFIIDQHATDEKYNFEKLQSTSILEPQNMVVPQTLELTYANETLLSENMDIFNENGFEFEWNEDSQVGTRFKLKRVPIYRNWNFGKSDVEELIFMLMDFDRSSGKKLRPSKVRAMFASRACRTSVMIGMALSHRDMRRLVNHMSEMDHPWNCPHGRPTMRHLINLNMLK